MTTITYSKTPGCNYKIDILPNKVECSVSFQKGMELKLDETQSRRMLKDIHEAFQTILAPYFRGMGVLKIGDEVVAKIIGQVTLIRKGWACHSIPNALTISSIADPSVGSGPSPENWMTPITSIPRTAKSA